MALEVEQKFRVASHKPVLAILAGWDARLSAAVEQLDCYYQHPQRDFAQTDEALRIRAVGEQNCITYKGPKLDQTTKTRIEEEVDIAQGEGPRHTCAAILEHLGFAVVATVRKHRSVCQLERGDFNVEVALDQVDRLGPFVEIEVGLPNERNLDAARQLLNNLAAELGLSEVERRSYLELQLALAES